MKLSLRPGIVALVLVALIAMTCPVHAQLWKTTYQFYAQPGSYNGSTVYFLMTDSSSQTYAATFQALLGTPVNYSPLLANCLAGSLRVFNDDPTNPMQVFEFMPSLYYVTNAPTSLVTPQLLVFSADWPVPSPGTVPTPPPPTPPFWPRYAPRVYMPIWRLQLVTWNNPANATTLNSEAAILAAVGAGPNQVTLTDANVAIGATIVVNHLGTVIRQGFATNYAGLKLVRLPIRAVYYSGAVWKMIQTDFSTINDAWVNRANFAPWLSRFNILRQIQPAQLATQAIYTFWPQPPVTQLYIVSQRPSPIGAGNTNVNYSPLMNQWVVRGTSIAPVWTSATAPAFIALPKNPTNYTGFMPVVGQ